jgi:hypothetical protein
VTWRLAQNQNNCSSRAKVISKKLYSSDPLACWQTHVVQWAALWKQAQRRRWAVALPK